MLDLTEYGRVVHAEMNAICDAARLGRSVRGATLYCTTFPCHNCTKHILAAGIRRVVYIEPYPKSRAKALHANEIEVENDNPARVVFAPFLGIAPHRYRDIFQKSRRRLRPGRPMGFMIWTAIIRRNSSDRSFGIVFTTSMERLCNHLKNCEIRAMRCD